MAFRATDYHPKWSLIRRLIRRRADNCCEQCEAPNRRVIRRYENGNYSLATGCELLHVAFLQTVVSTSGRKIGFWDALRTMGLTQVVLTVAHMDRDRNNNRFTNLKLLCQKCHLTHDLHQHVRNRAYGRYHDREHQLRVFPN